MGSRTAPLRPARDLEDLRADPLDRYLVGGTFVLWVRSTNLGGVAYFGRPDAAAFSSVLWLAQLARHPRLRPPVDALFDCRELEGFDAEAFSRITEQLAELIAAPPPLRLAALVRPRAQGIIGATIVGLYHELIGSHFPVALCADRAAALAHLGRQDEEEAIGAMADMARGMSPLLRRLRAHLEIDLRDGSMSAAAHALAVSDRSLRRRLADLGTSFSEELSGARVRAAEALLRDTELKIEAIADRVGCSSAAHLSSLFTRLRREPPGRFRARQRH